MKQAPLSHQNEVGNGTLRRLGKPWVGILSGLLVLLVIPLGHTLMILMEHLLGESWLYPAATLIGLVGLGLVIWGLLTRNEFLATFFGFFAGVLIWTGWVEFGYVFFAQHLAIEPHLHDGVVVTKPEYVLLASSSALFLATIPYFFFNRRTGCSFFRWFHRRLRYQNLGIPQTVRRPVALLTATETIYILWLFYLLLLIAFDPGILGDRHAITYTICFGSLLWASFLVYNLLKIRSFAFALRYAIPTVIVFWNAVEIFSRWDLLREIWLYPGDYALEMGLLALVLVILSILIMHQNRIRTGTARIYNYDSNWGGDISFIAPRMLTRGTTYNGTT
jgi:hypothetical protein